MRIKESVTLTKRVWGRSDGTVSQAQRISSKGSWEWVIQITCGEKGNVGPALREIRGKPDYPSPVVEESSIPGAKDSLVINTICHPHARLEIVITVLDDSSVRGDGNMGW